MSERYARKEPNILDEAEKVLQKKQFGKGAPPALRPAYRRFPQVPPHIRLTKVSLPDYWLEMLARVRDLPQTEFRDEVTEIRREIDTLRMSMESIKQDLSSCKQTIDKLHIEVYGKPIAELTGVSELCKAYLEIVSNIDIVRQVFLVESKDATIIWTIVAAPPFEDSLRTPIYDAQVKILSSIKEATRLDFYVLNARELSEDVEIDSIIPSNGKLVWKR